MSAGFEQLLALVQQPAISKIVLLLLSGYFYVSEEPDLRDGLDLEDPAGRGLYQLDLPSYPSPSVVL